MQKQQKIHGALKVASLVHRRVKPYLIPA